MRAQQKAVVDRLWERLWAGGLANPMTAIEQISYLIFLRRLDDLVEEGGPAARAAQTAFAAHPDLRWTALLARDDESRLVVLREQLIAFLRAAAEGQAFAEAMRDASFSIPKPSLVRDCMMAIDRLLSDDADPDLQGDVYEYLLNQLSVSGRNGQFRTPRHVITAIVELVAPAPTDVVCDPAAGTAGFLVEARRFARERGEPSDAHYVGYDFDASMVRLATMNLVLHGVSKPAIHYRDALSSTFQGHPVDVILANPPFTGSIDRADIDPALDLPAARTELLFLERCRSLLRPGGRAAIIVPEGVLFGASAAHVAVRSRWLRDANVRAVISLPAGVFRPYTNVKTAILYADADGPTGGVWFCPLTSDGFSLDDRRTPRPEQNDLAAMPAAVAAALTGTTAPTPAAAELQERMWQTRVEEIERNGWSLSASTYQPLQADVVDEEHPAALLTRVEALEQEISDELEAFRRLLDVTG